MGLFGHISSNSLFQVRSPKCTIRNFPNATTLPRELGFSTPPSSSLSLGWKLTDPGLGWPPPGRWSFSPPPRRSHAAPVKTGDRNPIARLHHRVLRLGIELGVDVLEEF